MTASIAEYSEMRTIATILLYALLVGRLMAGKAEVLSARAEPTGHGQFRIQVTLRHDDSGWEHYANAWRVLAPDGTLLGERILYHPHVNEQPFTRSLPDVFIPEHIPYVEVEAQNSRHGRNPKRWRLTLPSTKKEQRATEQPPKV